MNSITKDFEHFARKVIEHARGSNGGFETVACRDCRLDKTLCLFHRTRQLHTLLLRRFAFFLESPFCPCIPPRDASCRGPTSRDSRPDAAAALTQPKICSLFNMLSPSQSYVLSLPPLSQPWIAQHSKFLGTSCAPI